MIDLLDEARERQVLGLLSLWHRMQSAAPSSKLVDERTMIRLQRSNSSNQCRPRGVD